MSYVGKILVVVQVVLSLLFMTFAGGVYAVHQNWRAKYNTSQDTLKKAQSDLSVAREELVQAKREHESLATELTQKAQKFERLTTDLQIQVAGLAKDKELLVTQRATQTGLAEKNSNEAKFRQEEAEKQRAENAKLQSRVDALASENRDLHDQIFTKDESYNQLNSTYERGLAQLAYLKELVVKQGLETDPEKVSKMNLPPPPVEGLVTSIRKNRAGRVQFVELSIGSDDGLIKSNELDVVRVFGKEDRSEWLGRVKIVDLGPNWAVAEVILPSKNGIIQEGDNVTSKLGI
ncbi:hypothetical protein SH668x_001512 [Planctomicrobium sp. SH668]|uniref:hypothetical protein n=1 Tax=Planctomicrobium sp. SH668 TaxID=3448126 RepID=UPI003F5C0A67